MATGVGAPNTTLQACADLCTRDIACMRFSRNGTVDMTYRDCWRYSSADGSIVWSDFPNEAYEKCPETLGKGCRGSNLASGEYD